MLSSSKPTSGPGYELMGSQLKHAQAAYATQELCESRGGHSGLPVPNNPYGLCGRTATLN